MATRIEAARLLVYSAAAAHDAGERVTRASAMAKLYATEAAQFVVDSAVQTILKIARTGKIGDGKIFLSRVDEAIRIRNEERGDAAL